MTYELIINNKLCDPASLGEIEKRLEGLNQATITIENDGELWQVKTTVSISSSGRRQLIASKSRDIWTKVGPTVLEVCVSPCAEERIKPR